VTAVLDGASSTPAGRVSAGETRVAPEVEAGAVAAVGVVVVVDDGGGVVGSAPVVAEPVVAWRSAMARMSPVFTSMTTAVPL
jgi:hypothetical protein